MDIKKIIEEYDIIFDSMEDETGVNEVGEEKKEIKENLSDKKPNMEQAVYDEIKIKEPEVAEVNDTIAKKLVKQFEDLEIEIKVDGVNPEDVQVNVEGEDTEEESIEEPIEGESEVQPELEESLEDPAKMKKVDVKNIKIKEPEIDKPSGLKEEKIDEVSLETAELTNDLRQADYVKKVLDMKASGEEIDREIAKEAEKKLKKNTKLLKKWKKSKGIEESLNEDKDNELDEVAEYIFDVEYEDTQADEFGGGFNSGTLTITKWNNGTYSWYADDIDDGNDNCKSIGQCKKEYKDYLREGGFRKIVITANESLREEKKKGQSKLDESLNEMNDRTVYNVKQARRNNFRNSGYSREEGVKFGKNDTLYNQRIQSKGLGIEDGIDNLVNIGFDKLSAYKPSVVKAVKEIMARACELGLAEPYDFGRGKGKYRTDNTIEAVIKGLLDDKIARKIAMDYVNKQNKGAGLPLRTDESLNEDFVEPGDEQYRNQLYNYLDTLSEYHDDIIPEENDSMQNLLDKYFYWVTEYNNNYDVRLEKPETDFDRWLISKKSYYINESYKKAKKITEEVVARFDEGKHEIVKCDKGYYNRYNIKEGKARFTTKCVESLPTALTALKKRFPKAEEVKESK